MWSSVFDFLRTDEPREGMAGGRLLQQDYLERQQVTHCRSTHTLLWSTKIIIYKRTQTLLSKQSNDLIKVMNLTISWMTQVCLQQGKVYPSRQKGKRNLNLNPFIFCSFRTCCRTHRVVGMWISLHTRYKHSAHQTETRVRMS